MTKKILGLPRASVLLLLLSAVLVSERGTIVQAAPLLTLSLNQTTFGPGDTLHVGLQEENPGSGFNADFYFGILLPDGVTVFFFTSLSPLNGVMTRVDANPQTFQPLTPNILISQGLDVTLNDVFVFTFSGTEPLGTYVLFALLTPPSAFTDGRVDAGDILVIDTKSFTTMPTSGTTCVATDPDRCLGNTWQTCDPSTHLWKDLLHCDALTPSEKCSTSPSDCSGLVTTTACCVAQTPPPTCCRVCTTGKACGDSCIQAGLTCHQPPGCACNG